MSPKELLDPETLSGQHKQDDNKNEVMASTTSMEENTLHEEPSSLPQQEQQDDADAPPPPTFCQKLVAFFWEYEFLILIAVSILLAKAYPPLGAEYLYPDITATWLAVCFIFVLAGLGLKTEELKKAFLNIWFNVFVQIFNFGVVSVTVYGVSRGLESSGVLNSSLADGMVIGACVPMTINMVQVLTKVSDGDEAAAIFNAAFGNLIGVFLSPVLILLYLGVTGDVNLVDVFYKLALRVVVPVLVGQILQKKSKRTVAFVKKHKPKFKRAQQFCLIFIVYTVFCKTFANGTQSSIGDIFLMIAFQLLLLTALMALAWQLLRVAFPHSPQLRVMGLFGCTHKTVAMGIPLINAIYENNPAVGLYTLPLLIWHPMQLVLGSLLAPRLAAFVKREQERLGITEDDGDEDVADDGGGGGDDDDNADGKKDAEKASTTDSAAAVEEGRAEQVGNDVEVNVTAASIGSGRIRN